MKKIIITKNAPAPVGPYSQAIEVNNTLYCSGQISIVPETNEVNTGSIDSQTRQVMKNIQAVLEAGGYTWDHVIKTTIFLTNMQDFTTVNSIYATYFKEMPPARSTIQVAALPKGVNVEIEVIASRL